MIFKSLSNNGYFLYWGYFRIILLITSGLSGSNVPTGIQIIARSYSDELVFQGGYNYEMLDPWVNSNENRPSIDL